MFARLSILVYAIVSYVIFLLSFVYAVGFVGNYFVPKSIDVGDQTSLIEALVVDLLLLGLFAVQHSVMARPIFKDWWAKWLPIACRRSTYVLISSLILLLLFWQWRPIQTPVWQIDGIAAWLPIGIYWLGWIVVPASTYMIDHFDLFGLRQAFRALRGTKEPAPSFKAPLLYRVVRHPIMLGFILAFWATPTMSVGHLLFAVMNTVYILVALQFEERDLIAEFGAAYQLYRRRVPMLVPRLFGRRRTQQAGSKRRAPSDRVILRGGEGRADNGPLRSVASPTRSRRVTLVTDSPGRCPYRDNAGSNSGRRTTNRDDPAIAQLARRCHIDLNWHSQIY